MWFLPFLFLFQLSHSIEVCYTKGECLNSPYVFLPQTETSKACHNECLANEECFAFTWYGSTNICLGFLDCVNFSNSSCSDCVSGLKNCQEPVCFETGRCNGALLDFQHAEDENECLNICQSHPSCTWFTFDEQIYECFLMDGCSQLNSSCVSCQSGQINCQYKPEPSKIMVIGGFPDHGDEIKVIDLTSIDMICANPPQLQTFLWQAAAFMHKGTVHICGGLEGTPSEYQEVKTCRFLDSQDSAWFDTTPMIEERHAFHAIKIGFEEYWLLGASSTDSTEILRDGKFYPGPLMPLRLDRYCAVKINSTFAFIGGGRNLDSTVSSFSDASFLLNLKSMEWIKLPAMMGERYAPACGMFKDEDGNEFVVRAGGRSNSNELRKDTEILDLRTLTWSSGPDLPFTLDSANLGVAQFKEHFVITGGYSSTDDGVVITKGTLLKFDKSQKWHLLAQTILPTSEHTVIPIPNEMADCSLKKK